MWDMPEWRREDGTLMIWDPTSHTYVEGPADGADTKVDRGHASGGDNDLFDPAAGNDGDGDGNLFQPSNPDNNGWLDGKTSSVQTPAVGERFQMLHVGDYESGLEGYGQPPTDEYWVDIIVTRVNDDGVLFEDTQNQMPEFKLWFEWQEDINNGAIRPLGHTAAHLPLNPNQWDFASGHDWYPSSPTPGAWAPGKYDDWRCPNCNTPVNLEPVESAPWNKDVHAGIGFFNWDCPKCSTQGYYYPDEKLVPRDPEIVRNAEGRAESVNCPCGENIPLWNYWANQCPTCERDYDANGNLLAPRSQWGEETGEGHYDFENGFQSDFNDPELNRQLMWDNLKKFDVGGDDPSDRLSKVANGLLPDWFKNAEPGDEIVVGNEHHDRLVQMQSRTFMDTEVIIAGDDTGLEFVIQPDGDVYWMDIDGPEYFGEVRVDAASQGEWDLPDNEPGDLTLPEHWGKIGMAMRPEQWAELVRENPYVYHVTEPNRLPSIQAHGLVPGSAVSDKTEGVWAEAGGIPARPGFIYLWATAEGAEHGADWFLGISNPTILTIDASYLDPKLIEADEDYASDDPAAFVDKHGGPTPEEFYGNPEEYDQGNWSGYSPQEIAAEAGSNWAVENPLLSDPDVTYESYKGFGDRGDYYGRIAYGGPIPAEAIVDIKGGLGPHASKTASGRVMYHFSPAQNRESILAHGLDPSYGMSESVIWLTLDPNPYWVEAEGDDLWEVNVDGFDIKNPDEVGRATTEDWWICTEPIGPERLHLMDARMAKTALDATLAPPMPDINYVLDYNPEDLNDTGWNARYNNEKLGSWHVCKDCYREGMTWQAARDFLMEMAPEEPAINALEFAPENKPFYFEYQDAYLGRCTYEISKGKLAKTAEVAEIAPAMPDLNYVLDYNPEDQQEQGWHAYIGGNMFDWVWQQYPEMRQDPKILPNFEHYGTWQQCWQWCAEAVKRHAESEYKHNIPMNNFIPAEIEAQIMNATPNEPMRLEWEIPSLNRFNPTAFGKKAWMGIEPVDSKTSSTKQAMPYHVSPRGNREDIEREGLQDMTGAGGLYFWDHPDQAKAYWDWLTSLNQFGRPDADVWEFEVPDHIEPEPDDYLHYDISQSYGHDPRALEPFTSPPWDSDDPETAGFGAWFAPGLKEVPPDKLKRVAMPYWHTSPRENRDSIESQGLIPGGGRPKPADDWMRPGRNDHVFLTQEPYDPEEADSVGMDIYEVSDEDAANLGLVPDPTGDAETYGMSDKWWATPHTIPPDKVRRIGMAERSGDPVLDQLIEEFSRQHDTEKLRDPRNAWSECIYYSEAFAAYLQQRGVDAKVIILPRDEEWGRTQTMYQDPNYSEEEWANMGITWNQAPPGATLNGLEYQGGDFEDHHAVQVELNGHKYIVDWTATQYDGKGEVPHIFRLDGNGGWRPDF